MYIKSVVIYKGSSLGSYPGERLNCQLKEGNGSHVQARFEPYPLQQERKRTMNWKVVFPDLQQPRYPFAGLGPPSEFLSSPPQPADVGPRAHGPRPLHDVPCHPAASHSLLDETELDEGREGETQLARAERQSLL